MKGLNLLRDPGLINRGKYRWAARDALKFAKVVVTYNSWCCESHYIYRRLYPTEHRLHYQIAVPTLVLQLSKFLNTQN